jgi:hypothetical protein
MAKRKTGSKVQRAKLRGKARRVSKAAKATKRTVARAKPKRAPVKKEQPAAGVIAVTEVEEPREVD